MHPADERDKWGGQALLLGMDLSSWPRVRKVFVDWGYRGLKGLASSLGFILLAEQNLRFTGRVADRAYVLETGEVRIEGRMEDLLRQEDVVALLSL